VSPAEQDQLIQDFIACVPKFDAMSECKESNPIAWEFRTQDADEHGWFDWRPLKSNTDASCLEPLYTHLPGRFPALYERLALTYRWAEAYLDQYRLLPNPLGPDLNRLFDQIRGDDAIWSALTKSGYIQFGRGPDMDYDPVCFDLSSRKKHNRDCRIVKIDHEEILCNDRVRVVSELAPSFEKLVRDTIERARKL
jgi:hypothetical protein